MAFEWDESKRRSNLHKHGVDFIDAIKIFANPIVVEPDDIGDYGEERLIAIGHWELTCFVVVYTWRGEERRIISAWKAERSDREKYFATLYG
jgi:uncharacterized DUF497 family protein